jgi:membrane protein implicated in regulation of membrane protease activity
MDDEAVWRKRLLAYSAVRFAGLLIFFLGIAIIYTDLVRRGGWPQAGAVLAIIGVLAALLGPRLLKRSWHAKDPEQP